MNQLALWQMNRRVVKRNNRIIRKKNIVKICIALLIELVSKWLIRKKPVPETNSMRQGYMLYNEIIAGNINRFKTFTRCNNKDGFMELVALMEGNYIWQDVTALSPKDKRLWYLLARICCHKIRTMGEKSSINHFENIYLLKYIACTFHIIIRHNTINYRTY